MLFFRRGTFELRFSWSSVKSSRFVADAPRRSRAAYMWVCSEAGRLPTVPTGASPNADPGAATRDLAGGVEVAALQGPHSKHEGSRLPGAETSPSRAGKDTDSPPQPRVAERHQRPE